MIHYTLTTEGASDRVLIRHIDWLLEQHSSVEFNGQWANPASFSSLERDVGTRMREAVRSFPCNLLFVHRDADNAGRPARAQEIQDEIAASGVLPPTVCVIPVRMTESWLLIEEHAVRKAAGNPRGRAPLQLPNLNVLEGVADPKRLLDEALLTASETSGRRRRQFSASMPAAKHRVAALIQDVSQLRRLSGFVAFEQELVNALSQNGWD